MSIIKYVTLQNIVAHDFRYGPRKSDSSITEIHGLYDDQQEAQIKENEM